MIYYRKIPQANSTIKNLHNNIKKYRLQKGLTQEKLVELCDISPDYISEIERGKKTPSIKRLIIIADILKIETYKFFME